MTLTLDISVLNLSLRYLASNFPKVLDLVDGQSRSALHYAAVSKEDGNNYHNILSAAGANADLKDKVRVRTYSYSTPAALEM